MEINRYLIVSQGKKRWNPQVKIVTSLKATMPASSIAIKLNLEIPDAIFQKPQLQATIKIKDEDISKPVINAQVLDNIQKVFSQQLGVEMSINIIENKKEE